VDDTEAIQLTIFSPNFSKVSGSMRRCDFNDPDTLFAFEECGGWDPYCLLLSLLALCFTAVDEPGMEIKGANKGCIVALKPLGVTGVIGEGTGGVSFSVRNHISVGVKRPYLHELSIDHLHYGVI
jgi:hypothetical protein